ncbi:MAG: imidazolonepropionase [Acholeplasmataceae bacterium]|nr:imidazolonepropionase [Acholeplasmataceae bacterium]
MIADLIVYNIGKLYTPYLTPPLHGEDMSKIEVIDDAFVAVRDGLILDLGNHKYKKYISKETTLIDARQMIVCPGFIDSHTHLVHAGSREDEYARLRSGIPYLEILKAGGGILDTVDKTRKASFEHLYKMAYQALDEMMLYGVTTVEAKSGYGLNIETEVKQLEVVKKLYQHHPIHLVSTYMGAHAVPSEFKDRKEAYIEELMGDMDTIKALDLAQAVDVFCETGVFSVSETKRILEKAKALGFQVKIHADEIDALGGAGLGVELGATSVDHLMAISDEDIKKLSQSHTVANLLPGTSFFLNKEYAPARKMIDQNVAVSIAGDFNPGSCPTENFQLIMQLASNKLKMTSEEILTAATINPAYHLQIDHLTGSLAIGKQANLLVIDAPNLNYVLYHFGINHVKHVLIDGKIVVRNRQIVREL